MIQNFEKVIKMKSLSVCLFRGHFLIFSGQYLSVQPCAQPAHQAPMPLYINTKQCVYMCLLDNFAKKGEVRPTFPLMFVPEVLYEFVVEK